MTLWNRPGVPQKGWSCDGVTDLETPEGTCEMCGREEIRYIHHMSHPGYPSGLDVGCVCAERMEDDYVTPRLREQALRNAAARRKRWLRRVWRVSQLGNPFINTDGYNITIFQKTDGSWGGRIQDRLTGEDVLSRRRYATMDQAKLGAFDGMIFLKRKKLRKS